MTTERLNLPKLLQFQLVNFRPTFTKNITMHLKDGLAVVLGGNGLGKTTVAQAIVYGLAGGLGEAIEENKSMRWDHNYFKGRIHDDAVRTAHVEVTFALASHIISVRRGFRNEYPIAFRHGDDEWIESPAAARKAFETAVCEWGAYPSIEDFAFVVHRLLYLSEARRLLAWDTDAQVRLLMIINQDVRVSSRESDFRERRENLTLLDSQRRHTRVDLNKAKKSLAQFQERATPAEAEDKKPERGRTNVHATLEQLERTANSRQEADKKNLALMSEFSRISSDVEALREQIERAEAAVVSASLRSAEASQMLALQKLLTNGTCPSCGTRQKKLQTSAQAFEKKGCCVLCGSGESTKLDPEMETLMSRLTEKLQAQRHIEDQLREVDNRLNTLRREESKLQVLANQERFILPVSRSLQQPSELSEEELEQRVLSLSQSEQGLLIQIRDLQTQLERDYNSFRVAVGERVARLREFYAKYATAFLGLPCELIDHDMSDGLLGLSYYIPKFNDVPRPTAGDCSEAQRFFLDIAFRMSLIDLAADVATAPGTFVCETPENALDMSYISNVAAMFDQFARQKHCLTLTANIQEMGFAQKVTSLVPKKGRKARVLNLLDYGKLSDVHKQKLKELDAAVAKMFE